MPLQEGVILQRTKVRVPSQFVLFLSHSAAGSLEPLASLWWPKRFAARRDSARSLERQSWEERASLVERWSGRTAPVLEPAFFLVAWPLRSRPSSRVWRPPWR